MWHDSYAPSPHTKAEPASIQMRCSTSTIKLVMATQQSNLKGIVMRCVLLKTCGARCMFEVGVLLSSFLCFYAFLQDNCVTNTSIHLPSSPLSVFFLFLLFLSLSLSKTSPCLPATRAHVFQHVRVVPAYTGTLNGNTEGRAVSSSVLLTKICPRRVITCPQKSTKETNGS